MKRLIKRNGARELTSESVFYSTRIIDNETSYIFTLCVLLWINMPQVSSPDGLEMAGGNNDWQLFINILLDFIARV